MVLLMVPVAAQGHTSLAGIGAMFAFFFWAALSGARARRRRLPPGAVGDPFAMGLLMAVPYLALGFAGHTHGQTSGTPGAPALVVILGLAVLGGWLILRAGSSRASLTERVGFWWCLLMLVGMLVMLSTHG